MTKGMARVYFPDDGITSALLPISVSGSKGDKYSFPFAINEPVWCVMDEYFEFGVIGGAIYSEQAKPPAEAGEQKIIIDIGASKLQVSIDRSAGTLRLLVQGAVEVECQQATVTATVAKLDAPATEVTGNLTVGGNINVDGIVSASEVTAGGKLLTIHTHLDSTGGPTTPPI